MVPRNSDAVAQKDARKKIEFYHFSDTFSPIPPPLAVEMWRKRRFSVLRRHITAPHTGDAAVL